MNGQLAGRYGRAPMMLALIACFVCAVHVHSGLAQEPGVLVQGRVLWVAAETMVIAPYVLIPGAPSAINIDLSLAHQDEYADLKSGDSVVVIGEVPPEGDRIIATSIRRLGEAG